MKTKSVFMALAALVLLSGCKSHYQLSNVSRTRILVDKRFDQQPDAMAAAYLIPYTQHVDSLMNPLVGRTAEYLDRGIPEGLLSNLLPDIFMWASSRYNEKPDFAMYNYGGIRAALPAGDITRGDILDVAPFVNTICFGTLRGADVLELFQQSILKGPHGVSHGVVMVFDKDHKLVSATINGKPIDPEASYRFTTLDYLAHGNDAMTAFKKKTDYVEHKRPEDNSLEIIIDYFKDKLSRGEVVAPKLEGRVQIEE